MTLWKQVHGLSQDSWDSFGTICVLLTEDEGFCVYCYERDFMLHMLHTRKIANLWVNWLVHFYDCLRLVHVDPGNVHGFVCSLKKGNNTHNVNSKQMRRKKLLSIHIHVPTFLRITTKKWDTASFLNSFGQSHGLKSNYFLFFSALW